MQIFKKKVSISTLNFALFFSFLALFISCTNEPLIQNPATNQQLIITYQKTINGVTCTEGIQKSGALYRICVPETWNRDLVLFAHGYVLSTDPIALPDLIIEDTTSIEKIVTDMGYAFATTSYSKNGLAIKEGMDDLADLVDIFKNNFGRASRIYLMGASDGGLITNLGMEKNFFLYSGGLSICGPTGDFVRQINYVSDFRVVFDYYFPSVIPGSPVEIPQEVMDNFDAVYAPAIIKALKKNQPAMLKVLSITHAAIDFKKHKRSMGNTFVSLLRVNVFTTNNTAEVLGGQPFDNSEMVYKGRANMKRFNAEVQRFTADEAALNEIEENYQTSGSIFKPLVMMHTSRDPIVPEWQQNLYIEKVREAGNAEFLFTKTVRRYGHCNFTARELIKGFNQLVYMVTGEIPISGSDVFRHRKTINLE